MYAIRQSTTTAAAAACGCLLSALMLMPAVAGAAEFADTDISPYLPVAGGTFKSVLSGTGLQSEIRVAGFLMRRDPVSQQNFLQFVQKNPQWRKDRIPSLFADKAYLAQWPAADSFGAADPASPVTGISWFAARAYCQSERARLPRWYEWELAAAADETSTDARASAAWRSRILNWYGQNAQSGQTQQSFPPNVYGLRALHGQIWEWVGDFNALLISPDSRTQGDPDKLQFCGAGAISLQNKENYAILMRVALLSSLTARSTTASMGFRCVRDQKGTP
ncbi:formylglycine-generating enzyme family protein [Undibacterium luofuense]|uniref:Formylglycine-generating enzyme family protein n=1 Tax=Undibacterium luofuense TaxID=2828733 RepID=A0A941DL82_9BURK|nr:formylglycine-generating enzyme family protein [Undibacterium luofuense]